MTRPWIRSLSDNELLNQIEHWEDPHPTVTRAFGEHWIGDIPADNQPDYYPDLVDEAVRRGLIEERN